MPAGSCVAAEWLSSAGTATCSVRASGNVAAKRREDSEQRGDEAADGRRRFIAAQVWGSSRAGATILPNQNAAPHQRSI
jgi:hypothetical protein